MSADRLHCARAGVVAVGGDPRSETLEPGKFAGVEIAVTIRVSLLEPVYGLILSYLVLKEEPSLRTLTGGCLILASVLWLSYHSAKEGSHQ